MRRGVVTYANIPLLIIIALFVDNLVIALGTVIGEGNTLYNLNVLRFWLALLTALLALFAGDVVRRSNQWKAKRAEVGVMMWIVTAGLLVLQLTTETLSVKLKPEEEYGVLRYVPQEVPGPPWMILIVLILLLVSSMIIWKRQRWPWMFFGIILMSVGSVVDLPIQSTAVTNVFELLLMSSLLATVLYQDHTEFRNKYRLN